MIKIIFKEFKNLNKEFNKTNNKLKKQNDEINKNSFQIEILNKIINENENFIEKKDEINEFSNKIKEKILLVLKKEINDLIKLLEKYKDIYFKYKIIEKENFIKNEGVEKFKSKIEYLKLKKNQL